MYVGQYHDYPGYEDESSEEECEHCSRQDLYFRGDPVYVSIVEIFQTWNCIRDTITPQRKFVLHLAVN